MIKSSSLLMKMKSLEAINNSPISLITTSLTVMIITGLILMKFRGRKRYHPIGGSVSDQKNNLHRLQDFRIELARKYKTYRFPGFLGSPSQVLTVDPVNVEYILKTNFKNYGKRRKNDSTVIDLLGEGIFNVDGEQWQHQRKLTSYEFSTRTLRDFSSAVAKTNAIKVSRIVHSASASNQSIDIQDLFVKATLDIAFKVLLGEELDVLSGTNEGTRFSKAFESARSLTIYRAVGFWKIKKLLNIGSEAMLRKSIEVIDEFVYTIIKSRIEELHKNNTTPIMKEDMLSRFVEAKQNETKFLRDIIINLLMASTDTTSSTLSSFFYMMCKYPDMQEKIANEVMEATGLNHNSSIDELAANITEKSLDKMQYLHAALTETLRLYSPLPADAKVCFSYDTFPDGFQVDKGDLVMYLPYAMGRMETLWGDDVEEFRPERWLGESGRFHPESPFKFTAFQAGPRICLGKEFAYRQMKILCMILLGSFVFKLSDEEKLVEFDTTITLVIKGGLHLRAITRFIHM